MRPSNTSANYRFLRCKEPAGEHARNRERAYDSDYDLLNASGVPSILPPIDCPVVESNPAFFTPQFRMFLPEALDRLTIFLRYTQTKPNNVLSAPTNYHLRIGVGRPSLEDNLFDVIVDASSLDDGGWLATFASPMQFTSIAVQGFVISEIPSSIVMQPQLSFVVDRIGVVQDPNPIVGTLVQK